MVCRHGVNEAYQYLARHVEKPTWLLSCLKISKKQNMKRLSRMAQARLRWRQGALRRIKQRAAAFLSFVVTRGISSGKIVRQTSWLAVNMRQRSASHRDRR